jgi:hypothetical protein
MNLRLEVLKHLGDQHDQQSHAGLRNELEFLRPDIVKAAQEVLDAWQVDEQGFDEEFGAGGACDAIAIAISDLVANLDGIDIIQAGQDGDDHAWIIARRGDHAFEIDIPPYVYETGGGYNWKKKPNVQIQPSDIIIHPVNVADIESDESQ